MTPQEALEIITNAIQVDKMTVEQDKALSIAQKALKKSNAKKPVNTELIGTSITIGQVKSIHLFNGLCPVCKADITNRRIKEEVSYCEKCGQKLSWESDT